MLGKSLTAMLGTHLVAMLGFVVTNNTEHVSVVLSVGRCRHQCQGQSEYYLFHNSAFIRI